jgi:hypothetical protein
VVLLGRALGVLRVALGEGAAIASKISGGTLKTTSRVIFVFFLRWGGWPDCAHDGRAARGGADAERAGARLP